MLICNSDFEKFNTEGIHLRARICSGYFCECPQCFINPETQKAEPFDPAFATMINYSKYYL